MEVTEEALAAMFAVLSPHLDERQRRLLAGAQARALGRGGVTTVARASGMRRSAVRSGTTEIDQGPELTGRVRRPGAGRPKATERNPGLLAALDALVEPTARGDPMSPLRWTCKSTRKLADELTAQGHPVSARTVAELLVDMGYSLLITADAGGSNGYRSRLWKVELGKLAAETGLAVTVCHLPPGTSKWNRIEHRLFSHISMNWRGRPLVSHEVVVDLIGATTTRTGLRVRAELDRGRYPTGVKVRDAELAAVPLIRHDWHGEWNYTITSATSRPTAA